MRERHHDEAYYDQDAPAITILRETIHKAKKEHTCNFCKKPIKTGDSYRRIVLIDYDNKASGELKSYGQHIICHWEREHP